MRLLVYIVYKKKTIKKKNPLEYYSLLTCVTEMKRKQTSAHYFTESREHKNNNGVCFCIYCATIKYNRAKSIIHFIL